MSEFLVIANYVFRINRTERLQNYYVFLQKDLELREHELILRRRQEQILKEISKYK